MLWVLGLAAGLFIASWFVEDRAPRLVMIGVGWLIVVGVFIGILVTSLSPS